MLENKRKVIVFFLITKNLWSFQHNWEPKWIVSFCWYILYALYVVVQRCEEEKKGRVRGGRDEIFFFWKDGVCTKVATTLL